MVSFVDLGEAFDKLELLCARAILPRVHMQRASGTPDQRFNSLNIRASMVRSVPGHHFRLLAYDHSLHLKPC